MEVLLRKDEYERLIEMQKSLLYGTKSVLQLCARIITPPLSKNCKDSTGQKTKIHRYPPIFRCAPGKLSLAQGRLYAVKKPHLFYLYYISCFASRKKLPMFLNMDYAYFSIRLHNKT
jgi:hypothetical protein